MGGEWPEVVVHGADESLRSLLSDVLGDMGFVLRGPGEGGGQAEVVLALVQRGDDARQVIPRGGSAPVVALLPFDDERLRHLVLSLGARGCYALGTPLEELKRLVREAAQERTRLPGLAGRSDAPGMGAGGKHDD